MNVVGAFSFELSNAFLALCHFRIGYSLFLNFPVKIFNVYNCLTTGIQLVMKYISYFTLSRHLCFLLQISKLSLDFCWFFNFLSIYFSQSPISLNGSQAYVGETIFFFKLLKIIRHMWVKLFFFLSCLKSFEKWMYRNQTMKKIIFQLL